MNWLQSILYGLLSGVAEFLPISSHAHQGILLHIFGLRQQDPICDFLVHLSILLSVLSCCKSLLHSLRRERKLHQSNQYSQNKHKVLKGRFDIQLVRTSATPLLIGMLLLLVTADLKQNLIVIALFLLLNGIIIFAPERMNSANKDARSMTKLDGFLIGICGALSIFPGISRVGATASVAVARGAEKQNALNWSLLLSIPALAVLMCFDILHLFTQGVEPFSFQNFLVYILSFATAYCGGYFSILAMRFLTVRSGFSGFAYYCWGASLFSFILYLAF